MMRKNENMETERADRPDNQDRIILLGVNHETAPVELREKLSFAKEELSAALEGLMAEPAIHEVLLFSTCNRVEVLMVTDNNQAAVLFVVDYLCRRKDVSQDRLRPVMYRYDGDEAVRHVFQVASGLDSLVVGEPQVFGQVKEAYRQAVNGKTTGVILNRLIHRTFSVAKRVRHETGIGDNAVSISYAAVELGRKIFGSLEDKKVLLLGAGEMAELAVTHLIRHKAGTVFVANRTLERAVDLALKFNGRAIGLEELSDALTKVDIVVSSTGAPGIVISRDDVKRVMRGRRNRPIFFIDIAVPRDIDAAVNKLDNAYLYDIDDLKGVVDDNFDQRKKEAVKAQRIVDEAVIRFRSWLDSLEVVPTVVALRNKLTDIITAEIHKTLLDPDRLSPYDQAAVQRMTEAIVNKIMHDPIHFLKQRTNRKNKHQYLDMVGKLFRLNQ